MAEARAEIAVAGSGADRVGAISAGNRRDDAAGNFDAAGLIPGIGASADARAGGTASRGDAAAGRGNGAAQDADRADGGIVITADAGRARAADRKER